MSDRPTTGNKLTKALTALQSSFLLFCVETTLDVLRIAALLLAIAGVQSLATFLFPPTASWAASLLELSHELIVVASGAVFAYRRLVSLVH